MLTKLTCHSANFMGLDSSYGKNIHGHGNKQPSPSDNKVRMGYMGAAFDLLFKVFVLKSNQFLFVGLREIRLLLENCPNKIDVLNCWFLWRAEKRRRWLGEKLSQQVYW